eukprot:CAMPEP_0115169682 /NCGR_PEP_ID=MMETSP0270-20121206/1395_1 /TAXON_ID=71861 /ORGANISM="Scrippsiella trochoidea, Strain CCMP3099" /LENGTH=1107 /DNA_ID=CAMNT_0002582389 /DNA_START=100 /DNA_END=3423 /DNA_ORIENTATION=-
MGQPVLHLYPAGKNYIGQLVVPEEAVKDECLKPPQRVLIMDHSGSMGQWSGRVLHSVFPEVLNLLGVHPDEHLLLILFSSGSSHHHMKVRDLATFSPGPQGSTNMRGIFQELQTQLDPGNPRVQILTLSDGDVHDQEQTAAAAAAAAPTLKSSYEIDARAVRLFTSAYARPDTRALASVLQLNTNTAATLVDLESNLALDDMAKRMAGMFAQCALRGAMLKTQHSVLQPQPWSEPASEISVRLGRNTFWLTRVPDKPTLSGEPVMVHEEAPMNQDTMSDILADRLEFFISQLRVLKVIDTAQAKEQIARIVDYFQNLEASLVPAEELSKLLENGGLKNRATFMRKTLQRRLKSVTTMMESIAKDDRVRSLNQAQQADYLRQMGTSKNSRALARRAQATGMDFDSTLRNEILQMKAHLHELSDLDAGQLSVSFYSQATTLEGILAVCEMADDSEVFEGLLAVDLLRLFNIIGIPCVAPVSDFPDPMTYRLERLMPGNFVSVADLSTVELMQSKLEMPGLGVKIANAIPYFEDLQIQRFLQRHAPSALEYICSIGMRRVLAEVPCTFPYTLVAGVWRLVQHLDTDKSELNVQLLSRMVPSYQESCDGRFDYLMPALRTDQDPEKSYWIGYNGITNMISPLWRLAEEGFGKHNARILRALYTFEAFQVMRRLNKQKDPKFQFEQLDRLLGVDFVARGTPLPEMFSRPQPVHDQKVRVNRECLAELSQAMCHTKYATIIPPLFSAIRESDPVSAVRTIPQISDETLVKALNLDYPLEEFMMYNIVEGFLFQSKQLRVDKENSKSLRPDLGVRLEGQRMCQEYILSRYSEDYEARLKHMAGDERKRILDELIEEGLATDSMATFCRLLSEGIQRGEVSFKIANFNSYGCRELHDALMDTTRAVLKRAEKIAVFYTGEDAEQNVVWNGGNMYRAAAGPLQKILADMGEESTWALIQERYKCKKSHVYRGGKCSCNRHGHSNDKASFFAFGHNSLISYFSVMSLEARSEYLQEHPTCCALATEREPESLQAAIDNLVAKRERRQECEADPSKLSAAIKKTMAQRKERKAMARQRPVGYSHFHGWGRAYDPSKGKGKGKGTSSSEDDDSDSDSDS